MFVRIFVAVPWRRVSNDSGVVESSDLPTPSICCILSIDCGSSVQLVVHHVAQQTIATCRNKWSINAQRYAFAVMLSKAKLLWPKTRPRPKP